VAEILFDKLIASIYNDDRVKKHMKDFDEYMTQSICGFMIPIYMDKRLGGGKK